MPSTKPTVFISYSHEDEAWKDRLETQLNVLQMEGLLDVWSDQKIRDGDDWQDKIRAAIESAAVAVFLVSPDSLSSNFIKKSEVDPALERRKTEGLTCITIIIRPSPLKQVKWLNGMQHRLSGGKPLSMRGRELAEATLAEIANDIAEIVRGLADGQEPSPKRKATAKGPKQISDEANRLYVRGRYHWNLRYEGGLLKGKSDFEEAIKRAPDYAGPYAGLADCYLLTTA